MIESTKNKLLHWIFHSNALTTIRISIKDDKITKSIHCCVRCNPDKYYEDYKIMMEKCGKLLK